MLSNMGRYVPKTHSIFRSNNCISRRFTTSPIKSLSIKWTYSELLDTHPMTTKMFSSGVLLTIADSLCQFIEHTNKNRRLAESFPTNDSTESSSTFTLDVSRLVRFSLMGAFFIAPATHHWYNYLTKVLPFPKPNTPHFVTTLKRVVLDQVAFAPFFIPAFFAALSTLEGKVSERSGAERGGVTKWKMRELKFKPTHPNSLSLDAECCPNN